jgi:hypothetical protein
MDLPPNPTAVPTIIYEYLFYLLSSEMALPTSSMEASWAGEPITLYWIWPHHSWLKRRVHQLKKN